MDKYATPQAIIKALKAPNDPPASGEPSKLAIAQRAWISSNIYFPNKDEVLVDWLLTTLLKEKSNESIILSQEYWKLLQDVLEAGGHARKSWLNPLLNRIPVTAIFTNFMNTLIASEVNHGDALECFSKPMLTLWPFASSRASLETLMDCFTSTLSLLSSRKTLGPSISGLLSNVLKSYRLSYGNASNKKKALASFIQTQFPLFATIYNFSPEMVPENSIEKAKSLQSEVHQTVVDVLFSAASLKASQDPFYQLLTSNHYTTLPPSASCLNVIPLLYKDYIQELRKHRNIVFGSGSTQTQDSTVQGKFRDAAFRGFVTAYQTLSGTQGEWGNLSRLVEVLQEANVVGYGLSEKTDVLNDFVVSATNVLSFESADETSTVNAALSALASVCRMDFDIVIPHIPVILENLLLENKSTYPKAGEILSEFISFYAKTRTLPTYITLFLDCIVSSTSKRLQCANAWPADVLRYMKVRTARVDRSPGDTLIDRINSTQLRARAILADGPHGDTLTDIINSTQLETLADAVSISHIEMLARAVSSYVTPGQTPEVARSLIAYLDELWKAFSDGLEDDADVDRERPKKKRKTTNAGVDSENVLFSPSDLTAFTYSLVARSVAALLPSLPFSTLTSSVFASIETRVADMLSHSIQATLLTLHELDITMVEWGRQAMDAAALRVCHAIVRCPEFNCNNISISLAPDKVTALIGSKNALPELVIESLRLFFDVSACSASNEERESVFDELMQYLLRNLLFTNSLKPRGHEAGALVVWNLVLDRWLPLIDELAAEETLLKLSQLCLRLYSKKDTTSFAEANYALDRALKSAAFWEIPRLRNMINRQVVELEDYKKSTHFLVCIAFLLRAPPEYLPYSSRVLLTQKVIEFERELVRSEKNSSAPPMHLAQDELMTVRMWLNSLLESVAGVVLQEFLKPLGDESMLWNYLLFLCRTAGKAGSALETATREIQHAVFRLIVRSAMQGRDSYLIELADAIRSHANDNLSNSYYSLLGTHLRLECLKKEKLSQACTLSLEKLHSAMSAKRNVSFEEIDCFSMDGCNVIELHMACLSHGQWLNSKVKQPLLGKKLLLNYFRDGWEKVLMSTSRDAGLAARDLLPQLLLQESTFVPTTEQESHMDLFAAAYLMKAEDGGIADGYLREACEELPMAQFSYMLGLLLDTIALDHSASRIRTAVHMTRSLLYASPEGTMKICQDHFESCVRIFNSRDVFHRGSVCDLTREVLDFVLTYCSEKPSALRNSDVGYVWLLLAKILTPSSTHASTSDTQLIVCITSIAGTLIRLRRDLVTSTLPHLGFILSTLCRSLISPRPQLGSRQHSQITDMLPWFISTTQFAGESEARAVARLFTTLQAKTIPRTFTSKHRDGEIGKGGKASSLVGAFSKHAGPVLGTYINLLVNPLVVVSSEIRGALESGLFALCESMGEHGRDALMASGLDASGRIVMKSIWQEYEKQRYTGKG